LLNQPHLLVLKHITMAADAQEATLSKVDSAVSDQPASPSDEKPKHKRSSSSAANVFNINDLGWCHQAAHVCYKSDIGRLLTSRMTEKEGVEIKIAPETQRLNW
jgi:hypothetical protein